MKTKLWLPSLLICLCGAVGFAQAQDAKQSSKQAKQEQGEQQFLAAKQLLESRNFTIVIQDPQSMSKEIVSNYISVQGDSVILQTGYGLPHDLASTPAGPAGYILPERSEGKLIALELTPDKKGNLRISLEADLHRRGKGVLKGDLGKWVWRKRFMLYKNSNVVPCYGKFMGEIVTTESLATR